MGSQPQMSLALPCSALREGHWNAEVTTKQLAQHGGHRPGTPRGCTPRGQAEGDIYPKHCSVDQDKIFILVSHHRTRTAATSDFLLVIYYYAQVLCQTSPKYIQNSIIVSRVLLFLNVRCLSLAYTVLGHCMHKHRNILITCSLYANESGVSQNEDFESYETLFCDSDKPWMLCTSWVRLTGVGGWLEVFFPMCEELVLSFQSFQQPKW